MGHRMARKKILIVGDAACPSGFARSTHAIADALQPDYDLAVLGINYNGDEHPYSYPIFTAFPGGDMMGVGRLIWMCDKLRASKQQGPHLVDAGTPSKIDAIIIQQDGWNI